MEYEMKFCVNCYLPLAIDIANSFLKSSPHNEEVSLKMKPGKSGSFEIFKDDQLIFSKETQGRLPKFEDMGIEITNNGDTMSESGKACSTGDCQ